MWTLVSLFPALSIHLLFEGCVNLEKNTYKLNCNLLLLLFFLILNRIYLLIYVLLIGDASLFFLHFITPCRLSKKKRKSLWLDRGNQGRKLSPACLASLRYPCQCVALCDWSDRPAHPVHSQPHLASSPSPNLSSGPGSHCGGHTQIRQSIGARANVNSTRLPTDKGSAQYGCREHWLPGWGMEQQPRV